MSQLEDTADLPRPRYRCTDEEGCTGVIRNALTPEQAAIQFSQLTGATYVRVEGCGLFEVERSVRYASRRLEA
ncbi:MAG: hypothetical protein AAGJ19_22060 [Myxococcota bacterium]